MTYTSVCYVPMRIIGVLVNALWAKEIDMEVKFITNAFSLNMLAALTASVKVTEVSAAQAAELAEGVPSAVGHADTASVFSSVLGTSVPMARTTVTLVQGDRILVGQYSGPRLPEGATTLPEGATLKWVLVTIE